MLIIGTNLQLIRFTAGMSGGERGRRIVDSTVGDGMTGNARDASESFSKSWASVSCFCRSLYVSN
jgi:hypothetical protein